MSGVHLEYSRDERVLGFVSCLSHAMASKTRCTTSAGAVCCTAFRTRVMCSADGNPSSNQKRPLKRPASADVSPANTDVSSTGQPPAASGPGTSTSKSSPPRAPSKTTTDTSTNETQNLGETPKDPPLYNSTLLTAMRDYFGDDGREVQDYMKRPQNDLGQPMFRVIICGYSPEDVKLAKKLYDSKVMRGLYYCGNKEKRIIVVDDDEEDVEEGVFKRSEIEDGIMMKYADLGNEDEEFCEESVVTFATWSMADAVFVGAQCSEEFSRNIEAPLAEAGTTLFAQDVGRAIVNGEMDVLECLSTLIGDEEGANESLIE